MLCAVLAASGVYSIAHAQRASGTDAQTALAVPRVELRGSAGVALPQPFSPSEAARVRRIFSLQSSGAISEAARETDRLENDLLLGPILANRYLGGVYRPSPAELSAWLARFADQPDAPAIKALLLRQAPELVTARTIPLSTIPAARRGGTAGASRARALFVQNRDAEAVAAAQPLLSGPASGSDASEALFVGGLAAWRLGQIDAATTFFDSAYHAAPAATLRAASAYWAARAEQRRQARGESVVWMRLAAQDNDTFYGQIARRALGAPVACQSDQTIAGADIDVLVATPEGMRAFALLQVGDTRRAEAELRVLWLDGGQDPALERPLSLLARAVGFTRLATEVEFRSAAENRSDGSQVPWLNPEGGFTIEPSLIYALVRHESNFHSTVTSRSGARGLMQLMPATARAVAGNQAANLHDPGVNLAIGQRHLLLLSEDESVNGDLLRLLAGYGQGLYGLKRWVDSVRDDGEPLLFLEAIPNAKTRTFIQESLMYSWHYAVKLNQRATSLDALAAGKYPQLMRVSGNASAPQGGAACKRTTAAR